MSVYEKFDEIVHEDINIEKQREMCELMKQMDNSDDIFRRIKLMFDIELPDVVEVAFHLLVKFENNPYLEIQSICLVRYMMIDNGIEYDITKSLEYAKLVVNTAKHVSMCLLDDSELLKDFVENCIMILHELLNNKTIEKLNCSHLNNLYNEYVNNDEQLQIIFDGMKDKLIF